MQKLLFTLGRNPKLSMLELASSLQAEKTGFQILDFSEKAALLELPEGIKASELVKKLAGTVKIAQILIEAESKGNDFSELEKKLSGIDFAQDLGKKFYYTINDYSREKNEELEQFLLGCFKQRFKEERLKAMLKWPKQVQGERKESIAPKLLAKRLGKEHLDLSVLEHEGKVLLAKTVAASNPLELAERDYKRPVVKPELITSARLARILVNLAGLERGKKILDPFCGIGSILQEAMLTGHEAVGIEANRENASACEKNLSWCRKKFNLASGFKIYNQDSRRLSGFLKGEKIEAVVSEPYLGPFLRKLPSEKRAREIIAELSELYEKVFAELGKILRKGSKVVFLMPQIQTMEGKKVGVREEVFKKHGFKAYNALEKQMPNAIPVSYKDKENRIERMVYVLVRE